MEERRGVGKKETCIMGGTGAIVRYIYFRWLCSINTL